MKVGLAVLADYANVSVEGKLNIMGIFNQIYTPAVPVQHPQMHLVLQFEIDMAERGMSKVIEIKLLDEDGLQLASVSQTTQIPEEIPISAQLPLIAALNGLQFPHFGSYAFHILINEDTKATVQFRVLPLQAPPQFQLPPSAPSESQGG